MNCVAIGKILASGLFDEVFVPPAPGDSGTALGAALAVLADRDEPVPAGVVGTCYLGPRPCDFDAAHGGDATGGAASGLVAAALAEGKVVGICAGQLEAGRPAGSG
jgi:carbamoyltransferase